MLGRRLEPWWADSITKTMLCSVRERSQHWPSIHPFLVSELWYNQPFQTQCVKEKFSLVLQFTAIETNFTNDLSPPVLYELAVMLFHCQIIT